MPSSTLDNMVVVGRRFPKSAVWRTHVVRRHPDLRVVGVLVAVVLAAGACGDDDALSAGPRAGAEPDEPGCAVVDTPAPMPLEVGVVGEHANAGVDHVACSPGFDHSPPTSGDHFDAWQNCGFYDKPVRDDTAVHSLEHGAVWIAYRPDLTTDEVDAIRTAVEADPHLLAAPYPGLQNPIVLSAWTRQLAVDRWADPTVDAFLSDFTGHRSTTAPEPGGSCIGAVGIAPDQPNAGYEEILDQVR